MEDYSKLTAAELREAIEHFTCPFCGRGPFQVLARHTSHAHDISGEMLRDMAGYSSKHAVICAPEFSKRVSIRSKLQAETENADARQERLVSLKTVQSGEMRSDNARRAASARTPEERSSAGRARSAARMASTSPEQRSALSSHAAKQNSRENQAMAGRLGGAARMASMSHEERKSLSRLASSQTPHEARVAMGAASSKAKEIRRHLGEQMPGSKLNQESVREIRRLYAVGNVTTKSLGTSFGVTQSNIVSVIGRKTWAWVE